MITMAHHGSNFPLLPFFVCFDAWVIPQPLYSFFLCYQSPQLIHVLGERLKELTEDTDQEKVLKDIANATAKEKGKVAEAVEKKAQSSKKTQLLKEEKLAEAEDQLGGIKLKLAEAAILNLA